MRRFALLFAVLAVAMAIAVPASAGNGNASENPNHPSYWEAKFHWLNLDCYKVEGGFGDAYKVYADDDYKLVIVKGGPEEKKYWNVDEGDKLYAPWNPNSGKKYGISYIIYCECDKGGYST